MLNHVSWRTGLHCLRTVFSVLSFSFPPYARIYSFAKFQERFLLFVFPWIQRTHVRLYVPFFVAHHVGKSGFHPSVCIYPLILSFLCQHRPIPKWWLPKLQLHTSQNCVAFKLISVCSFSLSPVVVNANHDICNAVSGFLSRGIEKSLPSRWLKQWNEPRYRARTVPIEVNSSGSGIATFFFSS